jgi:SAM-dependent methyltransferase
VERQRLFYEWQGEEMSVSAERAPSPSDFYVELAAAEGENWWFKSRNRLPIWVSQRKVDNFKDYLEVGCGTGFVLAGIRKAFPQARLGAMEFYEKGLVFARTKIPYARFERMDAVQMRKMASYDVIGAFDVIEHIEQDVVVLQNLARAVRAGRSVVITVPQHMWLWSTVDERTCHVRRYGRKELLYLKRSAVLT